MRPSNNESITAQRIQGSFLKGPIDWRWICALGNLGGKPLLVGLSIRREVDMRRSHTLHLSASHIARDCGIARSTAHRALLHLKEQGFIELETNSGRRATITLLDPATA